MLQRPEYLEDLSGCKIQALDAHSYNLIDDAKGFGFYWCWTKSCRNYYQYDRSTLGNVLRVSEYI